MNIKKLVVIASLVFSVLIVAGALVLSSRREQGKAPIAEASRQRPVSQAELKTANGTDGKKCYVAVDGRVYEIIDKPHWINGKHTTSNGQAYCGSDMTEAIGKSPHGRSMLQQLDTIGPLTK